jgi:hypothetical protein
MMEGNLLFTNPTWESSPKGSTSTQIFQYDRKPIIRLAKALTDLQLVQRKLRMLYRQITKKEYHRVLLRNTRFTRKWVRSKPLTITREPIPEQYVWEHRWLSKEWVTRYEFARLVVANFPVTSPMYQRWAPKLAQWSKDPSVKEDTRPYRIWYANPVVFKNVIFPKGALGSRRLPLREFKLIPIRDWPTIRKQWRSRLNRVWKAAEPLLKERDRLQKLVAELQPSRQDYNVLAEEQVSSPLWAPQRRDSVLSFTGADRLEERSELIAYEIGCLRFNNAKLADTYPTIPAGQDAEVRLWFPHSPEMANELARQIERDALSPSPEAVLYGSKDYDRFPGWHAWPERADETTWVRSFTDVKPETLDDVDSLVKDFEDKRIVARTSLLNLNLRQDEVEFNWFRSLGELKDTPQTVSTGKAFLDWCRGANGLKYVEAVTVSGKRVQLHTGVLNIAQATALRNPTRKALAGAGWKSATVRTVSRTTPLKLLAGIYLSWKFAVAPTIGDIDKLAQDGLAYCTATRRGLAQLMRSHDSAFWAERSLRRQFSATGLDLRGINFRKKAGASTIDTRVPLSGTFHAEETITLYRSDTELAEIISDAYEAPVAMDHGAHCYESVKLRLWLPAINPRNYGSYTVQEYFEAIQSHNREVMGGWQEECSPRVYWAQHLLGVMFGRFTARQLEQALGHAQTTFKDALGHQLAGLNIYQTAWDLLPLSFVTEWFTNLRSCAIACNNVINMTFSGLNPSKKCWESLKSTVWSSDVCPRESNWRLSVVRQGLPSYPQAVWFPRSDPYASHYWINYGNSKPLFPELVIRLDRVWHNDVNSAILHRRDIHRVVRRPVSGVPLVPKPRVRVSITPPQAGSLAAMLMSAL